MLHTLTGLLTKLVFSSMFFVEFDHTLLFPVQFISLTLGSNQSMLNWSSFLGYSCNFCFFRCFTFKSSDGFIIAENLS